MEPKIKAYLKQIETGQIKSDAAKVLNFIIKKPGTNMIHMTSLIPMLEKTLSARLSGLEDIGVIVKKGTTQSKNHSKYFYEPDPSKQKENVLKRLKIKKDAWLKAGRKYGWL